MLTDAEEAGLREVLGPGGPRLVRMPNGVRVQARGAAVERQPTEVLFLARLQARKRPEAFVRMAALVHAKRPEVTFPVHGADEGRLAEESAGGCRGGGWAAWWPAYGGTLDHDAAVRRLARATVYVLPSVDEPFPMGVLEALAVGTPVVCTDRCGIAAALRRHDAAAVTDGSPEQLAGAVLELLDDAELRDRRAAAGRLAVAAEFSPLGAVADRLEEWYGFLGGGG
ncbi:glycosyltransferase family 4 protein [Streptomyces noursei]|uniref:glycosyltransferase family 4 protein n=1 Tax=Streptomyces noursei TaxID=1971 RepID=UPI0021A540AF|nr:glycosyltransferase [Streptomyces noursei]UWS70029.1 glycosyltransferase [Streptomyces noursei]